MAVQIKNLGIKNLALLKIAAEGVDSAGTDETCDSLPHERLEKGLLDPANPNSTKIPGGCEDDTSFHFQSSFQIAFVEGAGNSMKAKLIETEELDHTRIKVFLQSLSLALQLGTKLSSLQESASLSTHGGPAHDV